MASSPTTRRRCGKLLRASADDGHRLTVAYEAGPTGYALHRQLTRDGHRLHRRGAVAHPGAPGRPDQDRPAGRRQAGATAAQRRPRRGVGARRGRRGAARPGPRARRRQGRPAARPPPALQVPAAPGVSSHRSGVRAWSRAHEAWLGRADLRAGRRPGRASRTTARSCARRPSGSSASRCALVQCAAARARRPSSSPRSQAIRGIGFLSAVTIAAEAGDLRRFATARQFMAYVGLVPSEWSSGDRPPPRSDHQDRQPAHPPRAGPGRPQRPLPTQRQLRAAGPPTPGRPGDRRARPARPGTAPPPLPPPGRAGSARTRPSSPWRASWPASSGRPGST